MRTQFRFTTRDLGINIRRCLAQHHAQAIKAMRAVRDTCVRETKKRTPFKEGFLHGSITGDVIENEKSISATVYVPVNSPAASYAVKMHETEYNLGPGSIKHQRKTGKKVGPKYITRAIFESRDEIEQNLYRALKL